MIEDGGLDSGRHAPEEVVLLRIYISEKDRWQRKPLHTAIVDCARSFGVARVIALWGREGFGRSRKVHTTRILQLSYNLPIVVEISDRPDRVRELSEKLRPMVDQKLVTWERVTRVSSSDPAAPS